MTSERHLWACALEVERQHGEAAYLFAAMRADQLEAEGAFEGARAWREILSGYPDLCVGQGVACYDRGRSFKYTLII